MHKQKFPSLDGMLYNNQLQFNLDVPSNPNNMISKYQHPGPIILEKLSQNEKEVGYHEKTKAQSPVKLSVVSEEKLAWALQLARRDLKNMIQEQRVNREQTEKKNVDVVTKKKKVKSSRKSVAVTKRPKPTTRETSQNVYKKSVKTQTPPTKVVHFSSKGPLNNMPPDSTQKLLTWQTPIHTRERLDLKHEENHPLSKEKLSPDSRQAKEIKKLRKELKFYVERIEKLTQEAQHSAIPLTREEDERAQMRKEVKKAEQTSRSSRLLYSLQQQVRELQEDLIKTGPAKIKHTKRSRILARLAAAHRGAVRILQGFLHQLPDQVTEQGTLPPLYQELGQLINKLSLCTSQLEVEENTIPDGILNIFEKFQTPPRLHSPSDVRREQSPTKHSRRKLHFGKNRFSHQSPHQKRMVSPLFKESSHQTPTSLSEGYTPGMGTAQRLTADLAKQRATPGSPERNAAIQAGLQALMRIDDIGSSKKKDNKTKPKMQLKKPSLRGRRGVLLPPKVKAKLNRGLSKGNQVASSSSAHYLQTTEAFKLKMQEPRKDVVDKTTLENKPPWAPPGSPRRFLSSPKSPRVRMQEFNGEEDEDNDGKIPQRTKRVLFDDESEAMYRRKDPDGLFGDREAARKAYEDARWNKEEERAEQDGHSDQPSKDAEDMINHAERLIMERLEPLLRKADEIAMREEREQQPSAESVQGKLSHRITEKAVGQGGLISDLILEDILGDTVQEIESIEKQDGIRRMAAGMENASNFETMLQTLERMEAEEDNIRRRWKRVTYHDPLSKGKGAGGADMEPKGVGDWMMGTPLEGEQLERLADPPQLHTGIHYTTIPVQSGRTISITHPHDSDSQSSVTDSYSERSEQAQTLQELKSTISNLKSTSKFDIKIPAEIEKNISENRRKFENHLKRKSHLVYGEFDPWKLVTEVSDDIVDDILQHVAEELADLSGGFMDALYQAEFNEAAADK